MSNDAQGSLFKYLRKTQELYELQKEFDFKTAYLKRQIEEIYAKEFESKVAKLNQQRCQVGITYITKDQKRILLTKYRERIEALTGKKWKPWRGFKIWEKEI